MSAEWRAERPTRRAPTPAARRLGRAPIAPAARRLGCALAACAALAAALAGCGIGAGKAPTSVHLLVTSGFGASLVRTSSAPHVSGQETVMSLLMRNAHVQTRYGGGFVQSIEGLAGGHQSGQPVDWFYFVNGIEASKGAASTDVNPGDAIWWDRHDWSQTETVPAVVGSFPQPFLNGIDGKRLPVRVECSDAEGAACHTVTSRLRAAGVPAAVAALGGAAGAAETLRVAVAPWRAIAGEEGPHELSQGPRASGVYARFGANGRTLTLLDEGGVAKQQSGVGTGLIAATRIREEAPVWVVTGTDEAGVARAARAFSAATLHDHFAVAVEPSGVLALPRPGN
jgi:hypothetical protein